MEIINLNLPKCDIIYAIDQIMLHDNCIATKIEIYIINKLSVKTFDTINIPFKCRRGVVNGK